MVKIEPIIVCGMNRSGTKWLSNELARHIQIAAIQHPRQYGILETNLLTVMPTKFDLGRVDDFVGFVEAWSRTDFYKLTGLECDFLYHREFRPTTFAEVLNVIMSELARRQRKTHWIQKLHPFVIHQVRKSIPHARIILLTRNLVDTVRSQVRLAQRTGGNASLIRFTALNVIGEKLTSELRNDPEVFPVRYEDLVASPAACLREALRFVGLDISGLRQGTTFKRNSSFDSGDRDAVLTPHEVALVNHSARLFRLAPLPVLQNARSLLARSPVPFVVDTYGALKEQERLGG